MTWHTVIAARDELAGLLAKLRSAGSIITRSCPCAAGVEVTYITLG